MPHIEIFAIFLNIVLASGLAAHAYQRQRLFDLAFLRPLFRFLLFFILFLFAYLSARYASVNLTGGDLGGLGGLAISLMILGVFVAEAGLATTLAQTAAGFRRTTLPAGAVRALGAWIVIFAIAHVLGLAKLIAEGSRDPFFLIHAGWIASMHAIILVAVAMLVRPNFAPGTRRQRRSAQIFGGFMFAAFGLSAVSQFDFYVTRLGVDAFDPLIHLAINIFLIIWFTVIFPRSYPAGQSSAGVHASVERLAASVDLSPREMEIIGQLLSGRNNKEIAADLFISANTVKNHLYSIYSKLGVASRSQLQHKVLSLYDEQRLR